MRIFILFFVIIITLLSAKSRDSSEINNIVTYLIKEHNVSRTIIDENSSYSNAVDKLLSSNIDKYLNKDNNESNESNNYKVVKLKPTGWVIVSTVDIANPILGYSFDSNASKKLPIEVKEWLSSINKDIELSKNIAHLNRATNYNSSLKYQRVGPLLNGINLGQTAPYNRYTPTINGKHAPVGCVATAFAQIMRYNRWPKYSKGSHTYIINNKKIYGNFNRSYNYSTDSLAKLSYNLGVAFEMHYEAETSGTVVTSTRLDRVAKSFGYTIPQIVSKVSYQSSSWYSFIKQSIDNKRPIYYQGQYGQRYGGHAFILDGYSFESNVKMFHFNWGWSGYYNGWFTLEPIRGYSLIRFPYRQKAIFNIRPNFSFSSSSNTNNKNANQSTKAQVKKFKKADILYPKNRSTTKNRSILVKIRKNSAKRVKLLIYSYKSKKYIFKKYIYGSSKRVTIPKSDSKILIILYSYDNNYRYKAKTSSILYIKSDKRVVNKKIYFKKATLASKGSYISGSTLRVKWIQNSAKRVKLVIYSYNLKKYIYRRYIKKHINYISLPKNTGKLYVAIHSYDSKNRYKGRSYKILTYSSRRVVAKKAEILYPKSYQKIREKKFYIYTKKSKSTKVLLRVYSYRLKGYIYSKYITRDKIKIVTPRDKDTFHISLKSFNRYGKYIGESVKYIFIDSNKQYIAINQNIVKSKTLQNSRLYYIEKYRYKNGNIIDIKLNKSKKSKVKVKIYSKQYRKYIYSKRSRKNNLLIFIPKKYKSLTIIIYIKGKKFYKHIPG